MKRLLQFVLQQPLLLSFDRRLEPFGRRRRLIGFLRRSWLRLWRRGLVFRGRGLWRCRLVFRGRGLWRCRLVFRGRGLWRCRLMFWRRRGNVSCSWGRGCVSVMMMFDRFTSQGKNKGSGTGGDQCRMEKKFHIEVLSVRLSSGI